MHKPPRVPAAARTAVHVFLLDIACKTPLFRKTAARARRTMPKR